MLSGFRTAIASSVGNLFLSSATLVCCALPAAAVAIGAGASLASLISVFPALVVLSMHKVLTFSLAALGLLIGGWMQHRQRHAPCPADRRLAEACRRSRVWSIRLFLGSVALFAIGGFFAFLLPALKHLTR